MNGPVFPSPHARSPARFARNAPRFRATRLGKETPRRPRSRSRLSVPRDRSRTDSARPGVPNRPRPSFLTFNKSSFTEHAIRNAFSAKKKKPKRHAGYGDRVEASPFATESDAPPQPFADSPRLHKNKNSKFDVGTAKVGAGGFDAQRSRFDYETAQAAAAQMKARQLGGAGSFLSHD